MIQVHYIYYANADLTGGRAQAVMRVMGSSYKYSTHLLLTSCCDPGPNHRPAPIHGPGGGDPCLMRCEI